MYTMQPEQGEALTETEVWIWGQFTPMCLQKSQNWMGRNSMVGNTDDQRDQNIWSVIMRFANCFFYLIEECLSNCATSLTDFLAEI